MKKKTLFDPYKTTLKQGIIIKKMVVTLTE